MIMHSCTVCEKPFDVSHVAMASEIKGYGWVNDEPVVMCGDCWDTKVAFPLVSPSSWLA